MATVTKRRMYFPQIGAAIMLAWALFPKNPYAYYILLRWVICVIFAIHARIANENYQVAWTWVLGVTAIVYNPLVYFHLGREVWWVLNLISIVISLLALHFVRRNQSDENTASDPRTEAGQPVTSNANTGTSKIDTFAPLPPERDPAHFYKTSTRKWREIKEGESNGRPDVSYTCQRCGHKYSRRGERGFCPQCHY